MLAVQRLGRALGREASAISSCHQRSRPCSHRLRRLPGPLVHDHFFTDGQLLQRLIHVAFSFTSCRAA